MAYKKREELESSSTPMEELIGTVVEVTGDVSQLSATIAQLPATIAQLHKMVICRMSSKQTVAWGLFFQFDRKKTVDKLSSC